VAHMAWIASELDRCPRAAICRSLPQGREYDSGPGRRRSRMKKLVAKRIGPSA
jgi:hypothetical protein